MISPRTFHGNRAQRDSSHVFKTLWLHGRIRFQPILLEEIKRVTVEMLHEKNIAFPAIANKNYIMREIRFVGRKNSPVVASGENDRVP